MACEYVQTLGLPLFLRKGKDACVNPGTQLTRSHQRLYFVESRFPGRKFLEHVNSWQLAQVPDHLHQRYVGIGRLRKGLRTNGGLQEAVRQIVGTAFMASVLSAEIECGDVCVVSVPSHQSRQLGNRTPVLSPIHG